METFKHMIEAIWYLAHSPLIWGPGLTFALVALAVSIHNLRSPR